MDLLTLHPSFWRGEVIYYRAPRLNAREVTTERSFEKWQALRRNSNYADWARRTFMDNKDFFCGKAFFKHYFSTDYTPQPKETFTQWRYRVIDKTRRVKTPDEIEWEIMTKKVVWNKNPKGLPDRWLPIPSEFHFPHPHMLRLLSVELSVSPVPLPRTAKIVVLGRSLWVNMSCSQQQLIRDILSYDSLLHIETKARRDQAKFEAKEQLKTALAHRPRSTTPKRHRIRKRDAGAPRPAQMFTAWDMHQVGGSYRKIAAVLWPNEYAKAVNQGTLRVDGNRGSLLQRAKDLVKDADRLIGASFRL
jgi:hypothetical protein